MAPRISLVCLLCLVALALATVSVDAAVTRPKPKPIVLTPATARPPTAKPSKPDVDINVPATTPPPPVAANYNLYSWCTDFEKALVMNAQDVDAQQCAAYSTYNFGAFAPTASQKTLLCGEGCWALIDRLVQTPIPPCAIILNGRGINYIDALYVAFGDCIADPSKADLVGTNPAAATTPTAGATTPVATKSASRARVSMASALVVATLASALCL